MGTVRVELVLNAHPDPVWPVIGSFAAGPAAPLGASHGASRHMGAAWVPVLQGIRSPGTPWRNAHLADGVQRALGREPKDFADYARRTASTGVWKFAA